jgi:hypothetical protein
VCFPGGLQVEVTVEGDVSPHMLGLPSQHIVVHATAEAVQVGAP